MNEKFSEGDVELLKRHLQALIEVEFFTVPLYLTAVYSFTQTAINYTPDGGNTFPLSDLQQKTLSVAVQEMYHLQMASNLANAFDVTPDIPQMSLTAGETLTVPHLEDGGKSLQTQLGNLPAVIEAMVLVEKPDPNTPPPPNEAVIYPSIADLYHATLQLLAGYLEAFGLLPAALDPYFLPNHDQVAYGAFSTRYIYNKIATRDDAKHAANAVTDQGEGTLVSPEDQGGGYRVSAKVASFFQFGENDTVLPEYQSSKGSRFYVYDQITHYKRFEEIQSTLASQDWDKVIGGAAFYPAGDPSPDLPSWAADSATLQASLNTIWSYLIDTMQAGFQSGNLLPENPDPTIPGFNDAMLAFKYVIPLIWQWGECPSFEYRAGVTPVETQAAMDSADPLCLFHWDERTIEVRTKYPNDKNTCQGLNQCAGMGWGGIATEKGNGACATADLHTCQGGNTCSFQGGCGFLSTVKGVLLPASEQWIPGLNQGPLTGGCQTPVGTAQVFDRTADLSQFPPPAQPRLEALKTTSVWDEARKLFAQRESIGNLPAPISEQVDDIDYDGTKRRQAISPTSK